MSNLLETAILYKSDIVEYISKHTNLRKMGNVWRGCCPIHGGDNNSSFTVFPDTKSFYCFSCGEHGSIVDFVSALYKVDYDESLEMLAGEFNIPLDKYETYLVAKEKIDEIDKEINSYQRDVDKAMEYLVKERRLSEETVKNFGLGYKTNAIVIPLRDPSGRNIGYAERRLVGEPKYINPKNSDLYDKGTYLFNMNRAKKHMKNNLFLVEGQFDAMVGDQLGLPMVAYCGIEPSRGQVEYLSKTLSMNPYMMIFIIPDNDNKAYKRMYQVREKFRHFGPNLNVRILRLPEGVKDFADYGGDVFSLEDEPIDLFVLKEELKEFQYKELKCKYVEDYIKSISNQGSKDEIALFLSEELGKDIKDIREWLHVASTASTEEMLKDFKTIAESLTDYRELLARGTLSTGFPTIDESLNKFRKSEIMIYAAYAGVLKTFLAVKMALHMAFKQNKNVVFFSMEMSAGALAERMIANILGISTREVERRINDGEELIFKIKDAIEKKIFIVDKNNLSTSDINKYVELANHRIFETPVDCIFIDYLQYMKGTKNPEEVSETVKQFKPLAKDKNISIVLLSQLNRGGNQWTRPDLNQIRGSGDIEATGDIILGIWRPELNPANTLEQRYELQNKIKVAVLKARRGYSGIGEFDLKFLPQATDILEEV